MPYTHAHTHTNDWRALRRKDYSSELSHTTITYQMIESLLQDSFIFKDTSRSCLICGDRETFSKCHNSAAGEHSFLTSFSSVFPDRISSFSKCYFYGIMPYCNNCSVHWGFANPNPNTPHAVTLWWIFCLHNL